MDNGVVTAEWGEGWEMGEGREGIHGDGKNKIKEEKKDFLSLDFFTDWLM